MSHYNDKAKALLASTLAPTGPRLIPSVIANPPPPEVRWPLDPRAAGRLRARFYGKGGASTAGISCTVCGLDCKPFTNADGVRVTGSLRCPGCGVVGRCCGHSGLKMCNLLVGHASAMPEAHGFWHSSTSGTCWPETP